MPTVTITYSDEEKLALNKECQEKGMASCPCCNDFMWKSFHSTVYEDGQVSVQGPDGGVRKFFGSKAQAVLCEECWAGLPVEGRETYYLAYFKKLHDEIKPVAKRLVVEEGKAELKDVSWDFERYTKEVADLEEKKLAVLAAVKKGN